MLPCTVYRKYDQKAIKSISRKCFYIYIMDHRGIYWSNFSKFWRCSFCWASRKYFNRYWRLKPLGHSWKILIRFHLILPRKSRAVHIPLLYDIFIGGNIRQLLQHSLSLDIWQNINYVSFQHFYIAYITLDLQFIAWCSNKKRKT